MGTGSERVTCSHYSGKHSATTFSHLERQRLYIAHNSPLVSGTSGPDLTHPSRTGILLENYGLNLPFIDKSEIVILLINP